MNAARLRARQLWQLGPHLPRLLPWGPLGASSAGALAFAVALTRYSTDDPSLALRYVTIAAVIGCTAVLDDPSAHSIASAPTRLFVRHAYRILPALMHVALTWFAAAAIVVARATPPVYLRPAILELAVLLAPALALPAIAARWASPEHPSAAAAPAFVTLVVASMIVPPKLDFLHAHITARGVVSRSNMLWTSLGSAIAFAVAGRDAASRIVNRSGASLRQGQQTNHEGGDSWAAAGSGARRYARRS
jgi:hypothetical protein